MSFELPAAHRELLERARETGDKVRWRATEADAATDVDPVMREALHRDWASQVRSRLHLPTLHLLEHESFNEQSAGLGEGNSVL